MANLPVIAGFGGINAAGRSSGHHGYRRMIIDSLSSERALRTRASLAALTGQLQKSAGQWQDGQGQAVEFDTHVSQLADELDRGTLIRGVEKNLFDPSHLLFHSRASLAASDAEALHFELRRKHLPNPLPSGWSIDESTTDSKHKVKVTAVENFEVLLQCYREARVNSAGQLPTGFDPAKLYQ
jgi:acetoacetyl-[acyl-carrier protein] synthase